MAPRQEREPGGVAPHLLHQLLHQDELAAPLGHAHGLAFAQERDQLHDDHVEGFRGMSERFHGRPPRAQRVLVAVEKERAGGAPSRRRRAFGGVRLAAAGGDECGRRARGRGTERVQERPA